MIPSARRIWLIRHAQSEANIGLARDCAASAELTTRGQLESKAVARALEEAPEKIIYSAFSRSKQTARPIIERFPNSLVECWPVHEFTYLANPPAVMEAGSSKSSDHREAADLYWRSAKPYRVVGEGAESFAEFLERVVEIIRRIRADPAQSIAIVSHRKFLAAMLWVLLTGEVKVSARRMAKYRSFDQGLRIKNAAIVPTLWQPEHVWVGSLVERHLDVA